MKEKQSNTRELLSEVSDALMLTHILTLKDQSDTANTSSEPAEQTADRTDKNRTPAVFNDSRSRYTAVQVRVSHLDLSVIISTL